MGKPKCSIVVPVHNSQDTLGELILRLCKILPRVASAFEVILVNDGSTDQSWQVIEKLCDSYSWVRGMDLMRNYGQHNALLCGIRAARFEIIITMDDDLQHPPEEIPVLLQALTGDYDVVYGIPHKEQHNLWRKFASQVTKLTLQAAMGARTARSVSSLRLFRTEVRQAFARFNGPYVSIDALLTWGTTRFTTVRVNHAPRRIGASNYTFRKLVQHAINLVTGFTTMPLHFASLVGFFFMLFGVGVLIYVLARFFVQGGSVPGFPFLASVVAIFSGAQLLALGIIGEYLARMYSHTMDRASYTLRADRQGKKSRILNRRKQR